MGLKPLEFSEALLDSPYFRENIHEHERELDRANDAIKSLIRECKSLIKAQERKRSILVFCAKFLLIVCEILAVTGRINSCQTVMMLDILTPNLTLFEFVYIQFRK